LEAIFVIVWHKLFIKRRMEKRSAFRHWAATNIKSSRNIISNSAVHQAIVPNHVSPIIKALCNTLSDYAALIQHTYPSYALSP